MSIFLIVLLKIKVQFKTLNKKNHKKKYPKVKCNFILRDNNEIYLWDISERVALKDKI
jgi:lipopolysaccharide assembly outer membrane protein LptD (OstA)